ncbi:MAG: MBL fold metallo-hydrolase [Promethearchaeota archaeon]
MNDFISLISEDHENIFFITGERDGRYPFSNSLLIEECLFDTGISDRRVRKLRKQYPINKVFLSHWHEDHIAGNNMLENAKFYCHPNDKHIIEDIKKMDEFYGIIDTPVENLYDGLYKMLNMVNTSIESVFNDDEIISIGDDLQVKVIHTPGHSAGHCCFLELNSKIAFLSDIDLTSFGPWYAGIDSSVIDFEESIKKLMKLDIEFAITSHKGLFTGSRVIKDKLNDYLSKIHERDDLILAGLSETTPKNAEDLGNKNIIYKFYGVFKEYEIIAEKIMIHYHLNKFLDKKLVEPIEKGYILL